jgi:hypothetical protein
VPAEKAGRLARVNEGASSPALELDLKLSFVSFLGEGG